MKRLTYKIEDTKENVSKIEKGIRRIVEGLEKDYEIHNLISATIQIEDNKWRFTFGCKYTELYNSKQQNKLYNFIKKQLTIVKTMV